MKNIFRALLFALVCLSLSLGMEAKPKSRAKTKVPASTAVQNEPQTTDSLRAIGDSLRQDTVGVPLVIDGDTLLTLYARKGGILPAARVESARETIQGLGKRLTFFSGDSIYVYEGDFTTDVMAGDELVLSVTDQDALFQGTTRQVLALKYRAVIQRKVEALQDDYGLQQKLWGLLLASAVIAGLVMLIRVLNTLYHRWRIRLTRRWIRRAKPLIVKDYELVNVHRMGLILLILFRLVRIGVIFVLLVISVPLVFSAFPETKMLAYTIIGYIWNPITDIFFAVVGYLPSLFKIVVIVLCFRYLVKGLRYFSGEIANGNLRINGFYPDWAEPTFLILRVLCYSFMFVMIWPLLPSSNSEVFQGVSVFIGLIVSLGSTSIVGNVMAGLVMTYMRPFHIGDFIRYGDIEGYVIERTVLVTRIRTRKNDIITIPNSNLMGSQTSNYTNAAHNYGIIVHTKVTIGYDEPWQKIQSLLIAAAEATHGLKHTPKPFVNTTALNDFYVEYEINAYTQHFDTLPAIYSELHHNILDQFHSHGVEIMSPHIFAHRSDLPPQIPQSPRAPLPASQDENAPDRQTPRS